MDHVDTTLFFNNTYKFEASYVVILRFYDCYANTILPLSYLNIILQKMEELLCEGYWNWISGSASTLFFLAGDEN